MRCRMNLTARSAAGIAALCFFVFVLTGCSALIDTGRARNEGGSVASTSYAAAEILMQQSRGFVSPQTPLEIGVLIDLDNPNEQTNFGQMVAQQVASRFVQLGYNVTDGASSGVSAVNQAPAMIAPGAGGGDVPGRALLTGRYAVAGNDVLVNLRIVDSATGKSLAAYDYNIPKTRDVAELVKTQADKESFFGF